MQSLVEELRKLVDSEQLQEAFTKFNEIKKLMIMLDTLPPLNVDGPTAEMDRKCAREAYEAAAILSVKMGNKDIFEKCLSSLRPYYTSQSVGDTSDQMINVLGLNLLFLLVENRLSDFHCELELLNMSQLNHPSITFCTKLENHLVVGSYNQVLEAAANPPVPLYKFFLASLLATVRVNIGECIEASYDRIKLSSATSLLMFSNEEETLGFIEEHYEWHVQGDWISVNAHKATKSEEIPSMRLISNTLSYATELERIV